MDNRSTLTSGPVGLTLLKLTLPMMVGMVGMVLFNLVDTYFVGRLGIDELAAMSFTLPIVMLQGSIAMGLGVGASSVISRLIGKGDPEKVKRQTTDSLVLSVLMVIVLVIGGLVTIEPLFRLLGADGNLLVLVKKYMFIWYLGLPFVVVPMVGNNAIRAAGNTVIPSAIMLLAIVLNIILDPLLIYGPGPFPAMGLEGAALATVFARAGTFIGSLLFLHLKFSMISTRIPRLTEMFHSWKEMMFIGVPAAVAQIIVPLSMGVITRIISKFGREAVAAIGVGNRAEMFAMAPLMALSSVLVPFIGQNSGAGKMDRIRKGLKISRFFSMGLGLLMFLVFLVFGRQIGSVFNDDTSVIDIFYRFVVFASAGYGLLGVLMVNTAAFNALKKPFHSTGLNILRMVLLYIPLAFFLSMFFNEDGVFIGALLSSILAGAVSWIWMGITVSRNTME
jgi:putative MATE family efflux protein